MRAAALGRRRPTAIDTDASSSFACDYVAGVNRVLSLPPFLVVDNIGRNIELWHFPTGDREPDARARYDQTSHPGDPMASLLDVDLHAAFLRRGRELVTVNHYGCVRGFELSTNPTNLAPTWERQLPGDTERVVTVNDCLVTSSPRGEFTDDPPAPGMLLSEPIGAPDEDRRGEPTRLAFESVLQDWGVVTAVAVPTTGTRLAVAAGPRVGVFALTSSRAGLRLGDCLWEASLRFHCQWLHVDDAACLWAGGYRGSSALDGDAWDECRGGGVDLFAIDGGGRSATIELPEATAWGYGADPLVLAATGRGVYVLCRDASLHVIDAASGTSRQLYEGLETTHSDAIPLLGIGHAAVRADWLYAGFSRGGFQLLRYDLRPGMPY